MPTVFRQDGFRFFFYSNEGDPREPVHVHAMKGAGEAGTIGATPAVINAVVDALHRHNGLTHIDMPMTPESVWRAVNA